MNTTILQVPLDKTVKAQATESAREMGFSSLQDLVRVLVTKISRRQFSVSISEQPAIQLSPKAIRRYARIDKDVQAGKNMHSFDTVDDMMAFLKE